MGLITQGMRGRMERGELAYDPLIINTYSLVGQRCTLCRRPCSKVLYAPIRSTSKNRIANTSSETSVPSPQNWSYRLRNKEMWGNRACHGWCGTQPMVECMGTRYPLFCFIGRRRTAIEKLEAFEEQRIPFCVCVMFLYVGHYLVPGSHFNGFHARSDTKKTLLSEETIFI